METAEEFWQQGYELYEQGDFVAAIASYDKALEIKPDLHEAWSNRGVALRNLGRYEEAIASFDKALEIKPDYHEAWHNQCLALDDLGRNEEAIASYDFAVVVAISSAMNFSDFLNRIFLSFTLKLIRFDLISRV